MFLWLGINVDKQLECVKNRAIEIERERKFKNSCYTLPMHVSLKISFNLPNSEFEKACAEVVEYYKTLSPFEMQIKGIEYFENICWIRLLENENLIKIQNYLNGYFLKNYGVPLHEYDCDYKFHSTLFMDSDKEGVKLAFEQIKENFNLKKLTAKEFLVGKSESGKLGTYSVYKSVIVK